MITSATFASTIEYTNLKPCATSQDIIQLCEEAAHWQFFGICLYNTWIPLASHLLKNTDVKIVTVAGFPHGAASTLIKCKEIEFAILAGADEIDFVINLGWTKEANYKKVEEEFKSLVQIASGHPLKAILETCYLDNQEKQLLCKIAVDTGISFVKTSTGYGTLGATVEDVKLMKAIAPNVKASGGIKDLHSALELIQAGASRIGTSAGPTLIKNIADS